MSSYAQRPVLVGVDGSEGFWHALGLAAVREVMADASARVSRWYPGLTVDLHVARGHRPGPALVEESARAALMVLGLTAPSSSVTPKVRMAGLDAAACPVAVVRDRASRQPGNRDG